MDIKHSDPKIWAHYKNANLGINGPYKSAKKVQYSDVTHSVGDSFGNIKNDVAACFH